MTKNNREKVMGLETIMNKKYDEYRIARDEYNNALNEEFQYLVGKYIIYDEYLYLHVRKAFMSKDTNSGTWSLVLQGLGYNGDITYYEDDCEFKWSWWTEIRIPERIYSTKNLLSSKINEIDKETFRKEFKEKVDEMIKFNDEILDDNMDVDTDNDES